MPPTNDPKLMRVLSVNVSLPKTISFQGEQLQTGIFKQPVTGQVRVRWTNLEGDRQADLEVHGGPNKAVYAYSWENVEYWRTFLHRDDLVAGTFGENLTVEGLREAEVNIGDEFEIGTARFQVSQPRLPCFKLGIAIGRPDFIKIFQQSGRTGFYLRILKEGVLEAGDAIRRFPTSDSEPVSVAEMVRIYSSAKREPKDVARALNLSALPDSWKRDLKQKLEASALRH
jgi:MOSC domain-containing protein YiiM